jgi:hypothetical protein
MHSSLKISPEISIFAILKETVTAVRAAGMHAIAQSSVGQGANDEWISENVYHFLCSPCLSDFEREELRFSEERSLAGDEIRVRCWSIGEKTSKTAEQIWTPGGVLSKETFVRQCISQHLRTSFEHRPQ